METANRAYIDEERPQAKTRIDEEWLQLMLHARAIGLTTSEVRRFLHNPAEISMDNPHTKLMSAEKK